MKQNYILTVSAICIFNISWSQEFSFPLYFQDSAGNKDTLVLGFDIVATDSVDSSFNEINIISTPWDSELDVRITNEYNNRYKYSTPGTYHLKKSIIAKSCEEVKTKNTLEIVSKYWPITAFWDSALFNSYCTNGSFFTSMNPIGWWDVGTGHSGLYRIEFSQQSQVTFTRNFTDFVDEYSSYIAGPDTVSVFWFALGNSILTSAENVKEHFSVDLFPNPAGDQININFSKELSGLQGELRVIDITGKTIISTELSFSSSTISLNCSALPNGIYNVIIVTNNNYTAKRLVISR